MTDNQHDFANVTRLDEAPANGVIFSPDGRVFMDLSPVIMEMTNHTIMEVLISQASGNKERETELKGVYETLKNLNDILTALEVQNQRELVEKGVEV